MHLRKQVSGEVVVKWYITERLREKAVWELPGLLETAQNNISFATWIERLRFHFKALYNSARFFTFVFSSAFLSSLYSTQIKTLKLLSMCLSPSALTASSIWPRLSSSHFLKQSDNPSHASFRITREDKMRKEDDKRWPTHPVNRCMSIYIRHLWVMG